MLPNPYFQVTRLATLLDQVGDFRTADLCDAYRRRGCRPRFAADDAQPPYDLSQYQGQTPYALLGLPDHGGDEAEQKQAYRAFTRQYHPDVNRRPGAEEIFKIGQDAWDSVSKGKGHIPQRTPENDPMERFKRGETVPMSDFYPKPKPKTEEEFMRSDPDYMSEDDLERYEGLHRGKALQSLYAAQDDLPSSEIGQALVEAIEGHDVTHERINRALTLLNLQGSYQEPSPVQQGLMTELGKLLHDPDAYYAPEKYAQDLFDRYLRPAIRSQAQIAAARSRVDPSPL